MVFSFVEKKSTLLVSGSGRFAIGAELNGTEIFCFLKANDKPSVYFVHLQFAKKNPLSLLKFKTLNVMIRNEHKLYDMIYIAEGFSFL